MACPKKSDMDAPPARPPVLFIDAEGRWFADGREITHPGTYRLFSRSLVKEAGGYRLRIGADEHPVKVEDTPWVVRSLRIMSHPAGEDSIGLWLNDGRRYRLDPERLEISASGTAYCHGVPTGPWRARLTRTAWQQLLALLEVDDATQRCYIRMNNRCYFIG